MIARTRLAQRDIKRASTLLALNACLAMTACDTTSLKIIVEIPEAYDVDDDHERHLSFTVSIYAPGALSAVGQTCADFLFGAVDVDVLAPSLILATPIEDARLGDVPRDGKKLIVVDGVHPRSGRVLTGCHEEPPFDDDMESREVVVTLTPVITLTVDGPDALTASVPFDGSASVEPSLTVTTRDAFGEVRAAKVRVTVTDPKGAVLDSADVTTDAETGRAIPSPTVAKAGPFIVSAYAETPKDTRVETRVGFATPRDTRYDISPWGGPMAVSVPVRLPPHPVVFAGVTTDIAGELQFLIPEPSPGLPTFAPPTTPSGMPLGTPSPIRALVDENGRGALILQSTSGALSRASPDGAAVIFGAQDNAGDIGGDMMRFADVTVHAIHPVGRCDRDIDASPAVMVIAPRGLDPRVDAHLTLYVEAFNNVRFPAGDLADTIPERSLCIADDAGVLHRILIYRQAGAFGVVDLGPGLDVGAALDPDVVRTEVAFVGAGVSAGQTRDAFPSLLVAAVAGFSVVVEELKILSTGEKILGPSTPRYSLPGIPRAMTSGRITTDDVRDDFHILEYTADDADAPAVLFVVADVDDEREFVGGLTLSSCVPARACMSVVADLDGDGVDEVFVGLDPRLTRVTSAAPEIEIVRFVW